MPKLKGGHISPSPEEDAAITAGIAAAPDSRELTAEWHSEAKPASDVLPPTIYAALVAMKRPRSLPKTEETNVDTAIHMGAEPPEEFEANGRAGRPE